MSLQTFAKGALATLAGLGSIGCGLLYYLQGYLIYPATLSGSCNSVMTPDIPYEDVELTTKDGVTLRCYLIQHDPKVYSTENHFSDNKMFSTNYPTVIMFHGNGGNIGQRLPLAVNFLTMRCHVFMLSYRGYGLSDGSPSEQGLCMDAQAALDYILAHPRLGESRVILHGQSLGGAVAIYLTSQNPTKIHALMVENTFTSLPEVIPHLFPKLTYLRFLCHEKWESAKRLPMIPQTIPILMLSGRVDEVVPPRHMNELWAIVMGREGSCDQDEAVTRTDAVHRKGSHNEDSVAVWTGADANEQDCRVTYRGNSRFVEIPTGSHNFTCLSREYWEAVKQFINDVCL